MERALIAARALILVWAAWEVRASEGTLGKVVMGMSALLLLELFNRFIHHFEHSTAVFSHRKWRIFIVGRVPQRSITLLFYDDSTCHPVRNQDDYDDLLEYDLSSLQLEKWEALWLYIPPKLILAYSSQCPMAA